MDQTQAQAAAGPGTTAVRDGAGLLGARLRLAALAAAGLAILAAVVVVAAELAAARVPQQRAALEELIRNETGLEVSFRELSVRWGWYGPEAVFHQVTLGEPHSGGALLRTPQLVVGLDAWRMARSGHLEAGRITLVRPEIDVSAGAAQASAAPAAPAEVHTALLRTAMRVLSRWRGGRIDVLGGSLHLAPASGQAPLTFNIRHAQLRRLGAVWSADAFMLLPPSLGASAHVVLTFSGDPVQPGGTLSFDGRRLNFGPWRALVSEVVAERYLPRAGQGNLSARARFAQGTVLEAHGTLEAEALEWGAPRPADPPLLLGRLSGHWQLQRRSGEWHFTGDELQLGEGAPRASLEVVASADGNSFHGRARQLPLPALALWYAPLPGAQLQGVARELTFDWNAVRPAAARLLTTATLENVSLAAHEVQVGGLSAQVSGLGDQLIADLKSPAARLALARPDPLVLDGVAIAARLALKISAGRWRLSTDDLELRRADFSVAASGELAADGDGAAPRLDAHVSLKDADAVLVARLLDPQSLAALGLSAAPVMAGRIESGDFVVRAPLDGRAPWEARREFTGNMTLRAAHIAAGELWPDTQPLDARIEWHGAHMHASLEHAVSGSFELRDGSIDWDARGVRPTRIRGSLTGRTEEALGWLRAHPRLAAWTPGVRDLDVRGPMLLGLELTLPAARAATRAPVAHVTAVLDGAQLRALAGVPPIEALRGTFAFSAGHLQRSTLAGQWLGGPASLAVAEHREHGALAITVSGRGVIGARQALAAAGAGAGALPLGGNAEWNALMTVGAESWHLRADTSLVGLASHLPEPFAKPAAAALPLHVELQGTGDRGELLVALSDRLHAVASLVHARAGWRIERGTVRLAATPPELPAAPVLAFDGRLSRLDLGAWLALWRAAAADEALPTLTARLSAGQLIAGTREYPEVSVAADATHGAGELRLASAQLAGSLRWPARIDAAHPARAQFDRFDMTRPEDAALGAALATLLAPAAQLTVGDLTLQGRSLGRLEAQLGGSGAGLEVSGLHLSGAGADTRASVRCTQGSCSAQLRLETSDAAATLAALGLRPEIRARHGELAGDLEWSPLAPVPLASLDGHLHMQLEDGEVQPPAAEPAAVPCALLSVPALMAALNAGARTEESALRFSRLTATYVLVQGEASTSDLHFDGDAEILVRGRVGLVARDYDQQAFILRGEERLPAAVRRLGPTPRVAALWLSLRGLFTGAERAPATLRLHGTWSDPIVGPAE